MAQISCLGCNEMLSIRHKPDLNSFGFDFCINQQRSLLLAENGNFVSENFRPEGKPFQQFVVLVRPEFKLKSLFVK